MVVVLLKAGYVVHCNVEERVIYNELGVGDFSVNLVDGYVIT